LALIVWLILVWAYAIFFPISMNSSFVIFLSTLTWIVSLYALSGKINIATVALAFVLFMTFIFLRAQAWGRRWNLVDLAFGIGLPIVSLLLFSAEFGGAHRNAVIQLVTSVGVLGIILCGLYVMLVGPFLRRG
jgi:hypothetical protein